MQVMMLVPTNSSSSSRRVMSVLAHLVLAP
jgi:hypothetical protein